jgi:hypothetical protein
MCVILLKKNEEENTVIMNSPPRYELIPSSCVNNEVIMFNRQVEKKMKIYNSVKLFETERQRILY